MDYYKSYENDRGYNICKTAGSQYGLKRTEETKKKLREINTGKKLSEQTKQKLSEAKTGLKHSEETKQKIRKANTGHIFSEEHKNNLSEANRNCKKYKYYSFNKKRQKYRVRIYRKFIGWYNTEEEAKQAVIINLEKLRAKPIVSP